MLYTCPIFTNATQESQNDALEHMVELQMVFVESTSGFERSPAVLSMMQTLPLDVNLEILRLPSKQAEVDRMQHLVEERLQASLAYFQRQADASQRQPQDEGQKQNPEQKAKLEAQLRLKKSHAATPASKAGTTGRRHRCECKGWN